MKEVGICKGPSAKVDGPEVFQSICCYNKIMKMEYLQKQYDRLLTQVRDESRDLYWLYNFFFVIESALIGAILVGRIVLEYRATAETVGLVLSIYWLIVVYKQRLRRNNLIARIQKVEHLLDYGNDSQIWPSNHSYDVGFWRDHIFGRRGLWRTLFLLPIGFSLFWIILIF